jgi:hypothetical protein
MGVSCYRHFCICPRSGLLLVSLDSNTLPLLQTKLVTDDELQLCNP